MAEYPAKFSNHNNLTRGFKDYICITYVYQLICSASNDLGTICALHLSHFKIIRYLRWMLDRGIGWFSKSCLGSVRLVSFDAQRRIQHRKILLLVEQFSLLQQYPPFPIP